MRKSVLVVAQHTTLRAAIARVISSAGYRVELESSEKSTRQLLRRERFEAALIAPATAVAHELSFLRGVESAVDKLVIVVQR